MHSYKAACSYNLPGTGVAYDSGMPASAQLVLPFALFIKPLALFIKLSFSELTCTATTRKDQHSSASEGLCPITMYTCAQRLLCIFVRCKQGDEQHVLHYLETLEEAQCLEQGQGRKQTPFSKNHHAIAGNQHDGMVFHEGCIT